MQAGLLLAVTDEVRPLPRLVSGIITIILLIKTMEGGCNRWSEREGCSGRPGGETCGSAELYCLTERVRVLCIAPQ